MKIKAVQPIKALVTVTVFLFAVTASQAQSLYSNAVMSLKPVAYWPLQETTQPPRYDMETNYGSLGAVANAYYSSSQAVATNVGAILGDTDGSRVFPQSGNAFGIVPTTDHRVGLQAGQPFTVELWTRCRSSVSYTAPISDTGPNNGGGLNGVNQSSGWSLAENFLAYRGTGSANSGSVFDFHVFNNNGFTGGAEVDMTNGISGNGNEWLNGTYVNSWIYFACVYDGTNAWVYMYSTNLTAAYSGTNAMVYQVPITSAGGQNAWAPPTLLTNASFSPDTWDPIEFGCTRGLGANPFNGFLDEVAIYTNALTFAQITNHFMSGTNGLGNYKATILGDNPYMYWRMDAPAWTYSNPNTYPTLMNYGSAASNTTNLITGNQGANCGIYQPGSVPGVAGPAYPGFGSFTNACAFNGLVGAVDAGYTPLLNPTGASENYTLVAWFKGNPMDPNSRWNCLASHSDNSWKAQFKQGVAYGYRGVGGQPSINPTAAFNVNDGNWHMYTLVSSATNGGAGTNVSIYLDAGLVSATVANMATNIGNTNLDAWIGGAPDYAEPTNESSYTSGQQYFAGEVAHVAFFTNALSFNQIQNLFFTAQPAPVISKQPVSANAGLNGAFTNTVLVEGTAPFFYQWFASGAPISGATSSSLIINPVTASSGGSYFVVVTNAYGAVTSSVVNLTVVSNLMLTAQFPITYTSPITLYAGETAGGTNYLGSSPTFSVSVVGATPISYQWYTNGVAAGGANNSSFTFTNCQLTSPTNFSCVANNSFGSITSMVWSASYIPTTTAPFPQAVLAAQPIGYWRLNESPDDGAGDIGVICNDYQSGNNGRYTNVVLADAISITFPGIEGYSPVTDPTETSTLFDYYNHAQDYAGGIGTNIDFATPAGGNAEFSVTAWANGASQGQVANGGLVSKGHWGAEQFTLDEGSPTVGCLRFVVRDGLTGNYYTANSSFNLGKDSNWHYVVGICDEANSQLLLYVDGQLVGSGTLAAGSGVLSVGPVPVMIGARDSSTTLGGVAYNGYLNDVAIYNYALSPSQIVTQYNSAGIPVFFTQQPVTFTNVNGGSTLVIPAGVGGTPPLTMQWFDQNANNYISGQTSSTLVIPNVTASDTYYLVASNTIGGTGYLTDSVPVQVIVYNNKPQITADVKTPFYALAGQTANNSATVYGALPLAYQWQFYSSRSGWVNLSDNGQISGSQTSALSIGNVQSGNVGNYQLVITNAYGATTSSVATLVIPGVLPLAFGNGTGWTGNGIGGFSGGVLTLTEGSGSGAPGNGTYFFQIPQYIGAFEASFTYQAQFDTTYPLADGITFCLQDDSRGATATGSGGAGLGYTGIAPSAALQLNIYPGNSYGGTGYAFGYNGGIGQTTAPGSVNLTNGAVDVSVLYLNGQIALSLSNELGGAVFSTNIYVGSIPQVLGSIVAYVGFTGGYGGDNSIQTISNFRFVSIPPQAIQQAANNWVITWPGSVVANYTVQENSDLTTTNWVNLTNSVPILTNGLNQATVPMNSSNQEYFRLVLPLSN